MSQTRLLLALLLFASLGCQRSAPDEPEPVAPALPPGFEAIEAEPQRAGDPDAGYAALVHEGYVSCGVPYALYQRFFGTSRERSRLPGREGLNAEMPYYFTAYASPSGETLVTGNCFSCHASWIQGELVLGLGDTYSDYTQSLPPGITLAGYALGGEAGAEWRRFMRRLGAIEPYIQTRVRGVNPADSVAAALFTFRDPETLSWSDTPRIEPPPEEGIPLDVPPWWRMRKKNAMFYTGAGRGDHVRIMMTASTLCADTVEEAEAIEAYFDDVRAYILALEPPAWPFGVDETLASQGREVFEAQCSACHGTYGENESYPNLVVPIDVIGTDPMLTTGISQFSERYIDWFASSYYGERSRLVPTRGYMAPPLDGIWATAPYLHNGSVPDLVTLLDSGRRPTYWSRVSFNSYDYDPSTLGWLYTEQPVGHAEIEDERARARVYDTTLPGYSNAGHTFGDVLSEEERRAVIEYVKTL